MLKIQLGLVKHFSASDHGFSMPEVLIAILAAFAFLVGTLQALTLQAVVKVRAEREAQATYWIQQDIESIKAAAADLVDDTGNSRCAATTYDNGFAYKLRDNLFKNLDGGGNALSTKTPLFTDTANSPSKNFNIQISPKRQLVNKDYRLVRIINPDANNVNVLKITYRVGLPRTDTTEKTAADSLAVTSNPTTDINKYDQLQDNASGNISILAEQYVEVIPNAALTC